MLPDWKNQKDVENRDYLHLSRIEMMGNQHWLASSRH